MKTLLCSAALVVLGTSSVALAEPTAVRYNVRGDTASAFAYTETDCGYGYLELQASDDVVKDGPGAPTSQKGLWVSYYGYDYCTGTDSYGSAMLPLTQDINQNSASFDFALDVYSYTVECVESEFESYCEYVEQGEGTLSGNATLTGTGSIERGSSHYVSRWGKYRSQSRYTGSYRAASVSISATLNGQSLNFTSDSGQLGSYRSGSIDTYSWQE